MLRSSDTVVRLSVGFVVKYSSVQLKFLGVETKLNVATSQIKSLNAEEWARGKGLGARAWDFVIGRLE